MDYFCSEGKLCPLFSLCLSAMDYSCTEGKLCPFFSLFFSAMDYRDQRGQKVTLGLGIPGHTLQSYSGHNYEAGAQGYRD